MAKHPDSIGVFLETAHPIKFLDVVEPLLDLKLPIPKQIKSVLGKRKVSVKIKTYEELKQFLDWFFYICSKSDTWKKLR